MAGLAGAALLLFSCASDIHSPGPGTVVATYPAPAIDLSGHATYLLPARLGRVTDEVPGPAFTDAPGLLAAVARNLDALGLAKAADVDPEAPPATPPAADLAVNVTALDSVRPSAAYWLDFGGYLQPEDLGIPGYAWSYPWTWLSIAARPGTLLVELSDLKDRVAGSPGQIEVLWAALAYAVDDGTGYDTPEAIAAVDRAFAQSPYLVVP